MESMVFPLPHTPTITKNSSLFITIFIFTPYNKLSLEEIHMPTTNGASLSCFR
jgi:hypothetical protein